MKSPIKIDASTKTKLEELVRKATNQQVELIEEIDATMLGGFILKFDDQQLDASISTRIKQLQDEFKTKTFVKN